MFAASVALLHRSEVLLIQRNRAPSEGLWTLPGGRLEAGETAEQCAAREVKEELGLSAFALRPVTVLTHRGFRLQVFGTEGFEGEIVPLAEEVRAWRWVRPMQLAGLRTTPQLDSVLQAALRMFDRT